MKRKLIKQGAGGLTLTVPRSWIKENNLEAGAEVDIAEAGINLKITAGASSGRKEIEIEASTNEKLLRSNLWELYRKGYDKITVNYQTDKQKTFIQDTTEMSFLGFEVTKIKNRQITIENVTGPSSEKLETLQRRVFLVVKETLELLEQDLKKGKPEHRKEIEKLSPKVLQYTLFCQRTIRAEQNSHIWFIYTRLSSIQGRIRMAYQQKDFSVSKNVVDIVKRIRAVYEELYYAFYKKDQNMVEKASAKIGVIRKDLLNELKTSKQTDVLYYLGETTRSLFLLGATISLLLYE